MPVQMFHEASRGDIVETRKSEAVTYCVSVGYGWEAGIRTPITASRARCPTVERPPSRCRNLRVYPGPYPRGKPVRTRTTEPENLRTVEAGDPQNLRTPEPLLPEEPRQRPLDALPAPASGAARAFRDYRVTRSVARYSCGSIGRALKG